MTTHQLFGRQRLIIMQEATFRMNVGISPWHHLHASGDQRRRLRRVFLRLRPLPSLRFAFAWILFFVLLLIRPLRYCCVARAFAFAACRLSCMG